jgi:protocatechuate 3,4-dioxygenase beta subunit
MRPRRRTVLAAATGALALGPAVAGAQPPATAPASAPAAAAPSGAPGPAYGAAVGVVYDSLAHRPLAGATVQVVGTDDRLGSRAVTADSAGAFRVDSLAPGRYLVGFQHPLLALLHVDVRPRLVEVGPGGDAVRVDLAVPAVAGMRPVLCGSDQPASDSTGLLAGRVRDAADGAPVAHATVLLTWTERVIGQGGVRAERRRIPVAAGPDGAYVVCGVPDGEELVASAAAPGRASGEVVVQLPPRGFVVRDLALGDSAVAPAAGEATAAPDAGARSRGGPPVAAAVNAPAGASAARGTARLTGTVRDRTGRPVRGARALVRGTAAEATAGADGAFALAGLPAGTRTLEVRAIGFAPQRVAVDLAPGRAAAADVRLESVATLAPVTVFGKPAPRSMFLREFEQRRGRVAFGRFLTPVDIARRQSTAVSRALSTVRGCRSPRGATAT